MRALAFGGRGSGRTTLLINEIVKDMACHSKRVYIVAAQYDLAFKIRAKIGKINGEQARVMPHSLTSLYTLKGVDPLSVYFEHTAYELANRQQLLEIYEIEDRRSHIIWGAL